MKWLLYIVVFSTYCCINFSIKTYNKHYNLVCSVGELALRDTFGCQLNGYTCTNGDGHRCCEGRQHETRNCVPCDETMHKKPKGTKYTTAGNCDFDSIYQSPPPLLGIGCLLSLVINYESYYS